MRSAALFLSLAVAIAALGNGSRAAAQTAATARPVLAPATADTMPRRAAVGLIRSDNEALTRPLAPDQEPDADQVEAMVQAALMQAGGLESVLRPDARRVAIKPNLVELKRSGDGTVTDWRVVRAVARRVHAIAPAARVKVVEACNWDEPGSNAPREDGWTYAGYQNLTAEGYIDLVNLNLDSTVVRLVPGGGLRHQEFVYPVLMDSVDCFIDVPVVKVIGLVGMTAAMKNLVGMLPNTLSHQRIQSLDHNQAFLDEGIVDLALLHHVDFVVADALVGLERAKSTSWDGQPVRLNTVLASRDLVAADAVAAQLIGLNPDDLEYLELGQAVGLGVADPDRIDIRGDAVARVGRRFEKLRNPPDRYGQTPKVWTIKGPFVVQSGHSEPVDPTQLRVVPGQDGWSLPVRFSTDEIDLRRHLGRSRDCVAYAYTQFTALRTEPAELWVGSGEALTVWIDGQVVYRYEGARRHELPNDIQSVQVTAGQHDLLVRVGQTAGPFDFSLNLCEVQPDVRYQGNRLAGLRFALPGGAAAPVPRSGSGPLAVPFEVNEWATPDRFPFTVEQVLDRRQGLPETGLNQITVDRDGRAWIGTPQGVYRQTGDSTWTQYGPAQGLKAGWCQDLLANPVDGIVWAVIENKLFRFDGQAWQAEFPDDWHGSLAVDALGRTCTTAYNNGLRCYQQGSWQAYRAEGRLANRVNAGTCGWVDSSGVAWVATFGYGIWRYDGKVWRSFSVRDGLADNHPVIFCAAPGGVLWAGFHGTGLSRWQGGRWRSDLGAHMPDGGIDAALVSRDGSFWAVSDGERLNRFDGRRWATAVTSESVGDLAEDARGRLWLATGSQVVVVRVR